LDVKQFYGNSYDKWVKTILWEDTNY
jgi:hypothetical protein